eukprot:scaffold14611_cov34-Tisochrysis_lutea.AAC.1
MSRRHIGSKSLPHQRIRGKLMWVSRVSGSMQPQGTGVRCCMAKKFKHKPTLLIVQCRLLACCLLLAVLSHDFQEGGFVQLALNGLQGNDRADSAQSCWHWLVHGLRNQLYRSLHKPGRATFPKQSSSSSPSSS